MNQLNQYAQQFLRFLSLEESLPQTEQACVRQKEKANRLKEELEEKQQKVSALDNPGFFLRLMGRIEEKKEKAWAEYRAASAAYEAENRTLEEKEQELSKLQDEYRALLSARDQYIHARDEYLLSVNADRGAVNEMDARIACATGICLSTKIISALYSAREWMQQDAVRKYVSEANRKLEFLKLAEANAQELLSVLDQLEGQSFPIGVYLKYPGSYITGATSEFAQLDRLDISIEQIRTVRQQLRDML